MIRKLAISGVTTLKQYNKVMEIVGGNEEADTTTEEFNRDLLESKCKILWDDNSYLGFMYYWEYKDMPNNLTHLTFDEFISKYK